jgi:RNA polymerase sigma-70 factor, ECF subfamily
MSQKVHATLADPLPLAQEPAAVSASLEAIYEAWFDAVYRWARSLGGPRVDPEDAAQDVFLVVQRRLGSFDGQNVAGWLYAITQRVVARHRRTAWWRRMVFGRAELERDEIADDTVDSARSLEQKRTRERFYRVVARMNPRWRDTFVLFEVVGYTGEELAGLTGLPHATVRTHLSRARQQFVALLAEDREP